MPRSACPTITERRGYENSFVLIRVHSWLNSGHGRRAKALSDGGRRRRALARRARGAGRDVEMRSRYLAKTGVRLRARNKKEIRPVHLRFSNADDRWGDAFFPDRQGLPKQ